jgi:hypothetical protein
MSSKYSPSLAMREHLLAGHRLSLLEAILLFGVQVPNVEIGRIKRDGYIVKSEKVSMMKIIRRLNEFTNCVPPEKLPVKEIKMIEY